MNEHSLKIGSDFHKISLTDIKSNYSGSQIIDITCNFLIIFTVNPKVPLTILPRQFKIFAQLPKLSSWKV